MSMILVCFVLFFWFFFARRLGIAFVLSLGVTTPLITPVTFSKGAWHVCLVFGCDIPVYYPSYLTESFCADFLVLKFSFIYLFIFVYLPFFSLVNFLFRGASIDYKGILCLYLLLSSWFTACFSTFNGHMLPLMTLVDLYKGGPASFQSNCQSGRRGRNCIQAM